MEPQALPQPTHIATNPTSSFACEYVAGINRVLSLPPYLVVDNIARNIEVWRFASDDTEPMWRARYDDTSFPQDSAASLLDVDLHAAFLRREGRELLTVNHYGRVRAFDPTSQDVRLRPTGETQLLGDVERVVLCGDCFVGSSPQGEFTADRPQSGVFVFEPMGALAATVANATHGLGYEQVLADWGVVTVVAVSKHGDRLAVGSRSRVGVFSLTRREARLTVGRCLWETRMKGPCTWLEFDRDECLWAAHAGPTDVATTGADISSGGAVAIFPAEGGPARSIAALPDLTRWGFGADPLVRTPNGRGIYVLGGDASLHVVDMASGTRRQIYDAPDSLGTLEANALGIPHAALCNGSVYAGFSRGGFQLLRYDLVTESCRGPR